MIAPTRGMRGKFPAALWTLAALAATASAEFSPLSIHDEGLGMPVSISGARERALGEGGLAAVGNKGFTLANVSRAAWYDKTSFVATLEGDADWVRDDDGNSSRIGSGGFPSLATHIKTKKFGVFGAHYQQTHMRRFEVVSSPGSSPYETWQAEGGMYLLGLSYAYSPVSWLALGVSQNFAIGRDRFIYTADFDVPPEAEPLTGDTLEIRRQGSFPSASVTFRTKPVDIALSYTHSADLTAKVDRHTTGMLSDSVPDGVATDLPRVYALGAAWKFARRQIALADFIYEDWADEGLLNPAWQASVGYEFRGTDSPFDTYWKRASWRVGAGYKVLYLRETPEVFATAGLGLPLGPRGHGLDVSLKYGHRRVEGLSSLTEDYVKLSASIVGVSVWGQPARRRR
jgi:hypothetical protein